jgi:hypothetical protein
MTTVSFVCVRSEVEINQKRKVARPFLFEKLFGVYENFVCSQIK